MLRLRVFVHGPDAKPLSGVVVSLVPVEGSSPALRDAMVVARSDSVGYASVALGGMHAPLAGRLRALLKGGIEFGTTDLAVVLDWGKGPSHQVLASLGGLGDQKTLMARLQASLDMSHPEASARLADLVMERMFGSGRPFVLLHEREGSNQGSAPGSVLDPDVFDYELSPDSFVVRRPVTIGTDGCEHVVPAFSPVQTWQLFHLNLRPDLTANPNPAPTETAQPHDGPGADLEMYKARPIGPLAKARKAPVMLTPRADPDVLATSSAMQAIGPGLADVESDITPDTRLLWGELYEFEQVWMHLGHSLGEIKYSLALAPGEAMRIAVIDWARQDRLERTDTARQREKLLHDQTFDRDISEIVGGTIREAQGGFSAMLGAANATDAVDPSTGLSSALRLSGGIGGSFSAGNRDMSADALQDIVARTRQRTNLQRSLNSTVVIQASQSEQNHLASRIVANLNRIHALTIQYYEVLRQLRVTTRFVRRHWTLLVPVKPFRFTRDLARRFRTQLEPALLDHRRATGFDALERLALGTTAYVSRTGTPAGPSDRSGGAGKGREGSSRTTSPTPAITVTRYRLLIVSGPAQQADTAGRVTISLAGRDLLDMAPGTFRNFQAVNAVRTPDGRTELTRVIDNGPPVTLNLGRPEMRVVWQPDGSVAGDLDGWDLARIKLEAEIEGNWQTLLDYQPSRIRVPAKLADPAWSITFPRPFDLKNKWNVPGGDAMLREVNGWLVAPLAAFPQSLNQAIADDIAKRYRASGAALSTSITWLPTAPAPQPETGTEVMDEQDTRPGPEPNPVPTHQGDEALAELLINHLNANQFHYNAAAWTGMDARERRLRISAAAGPFADGLADLPAGMVGNHLVFPYHGALVPYLGDATHLSETPSPDVTHLSLPTRGVFAEAHLGHCNGAEVRDITRMWNFEELPVSLLPNIDSLRPARLGESPRIEQPELSDPPLRVEATPAVPQPQGVGPVITGLGKGDSFRDMSGLSDVSTMLGNLIQSAKPPSVAELLAAKKVVDEEAARHGERTAAGNAGKSEHQEQTEPRAARQGKSLLQDYADRNADRFQLIDHSFSRMPQLLHDFDTVGAKQAILPSSRRDVPKPRAASPLLVRFIPKDAFGRAVDAQISVAFIDQNGPIYEDLLTVWRRVRRADLSERQGWLPPLTGLGQGAMSVEVTFDPDTAGTSLVCGATANINYQFARGTRTAVFEVRQGKFDKEITVRAGETVEETVMKDAELSASLSPSRTGTAEGSLRALRLSASGSLSGTLAGSLGANWQDVRQTTYSTDTKFVVTVPLPFIEVVRVS